MNELQEIINDLNNIIQITEDINKKHSIVKKNRETLKTDTKKLQEISAKLAKLSTALGNAQLQIIAEEIDELKKERELLDSKKTLSRANHLKTREDGFIEGYSDRDQQQANYELLKEISEELNNININNEIKGYQEKINSNKDLLDDKLGELANALNEKQQANYELLKEVSKEVDKVKKSIQEKAEKTENLSKKLKNLEKSERLKSEINQLGNTIPTAAQISVLKEMQSKGITLGPTIENPEKIVSLKSFQIQNQTRWQELNKEKNNLESGLVIVTPEEREKVELELKKVNEQIEECIRLGRTYGKINKNIEELEKVSKELSNNDNKEDIQREINENNESIEQQKQEVRENVGKRITEHEEMQRRQALEAVYQELSSQKENEIRKNLSTLPLELRKSIGTKLKHNDLQKLVGENEQSISEENKSWSAISDYKLKLQELQKQINNTQSELDTFTNRYNELAVRESNNELASDLVEYKENVKKYIEKLPKQIESLKKERNEYQTIIRNYNRTDKLINDLISLRLEHEDEINGEEYYFDNEYVKELDSNEKLIPIPEDTEENKKQSIVEENNNFELKKDIEEVDNKEQVEESVIPSREEMQKRSDEWIKKIKELAEIETNKDGKVNFEIPSSPSKEAVSNNNDWIETMKNLAGISDEEAKSEKLQEIFEEPEENISLSSNEELQLPSVINTRNNRETRNNETPKRQAVKRVRKSKKNIKKRIIIGITSLVAAIVAIGIGCSKKENKQPIEITSPSGIENEEEPIKILSNSGIPVSEETDNKISESFLRDKLYEKVESIINSNKNMINTTPEMELEYLDDYAEPLPITESILKQAIIDSGAMETKAEDEYSVMQGLGEGITAENLQYWYDQGNMLKFIRNQNTGAYAAIEPQKDGSGKILGWWTPENVVEYVESIVNQTNQDFDTLYTELTGENYNEVSAMRGVHR